MTTSRRPRCRPGSGRVRARRWHRAAAAAAVVCWAWQAAGQRPKTVEIVCPCAVERDGDVLTATLGARNNVVTHTGELKVEIGVLASSEDGLRAYVVGQGTYPARLGSNETVAAATSTLVLNNPPAGTHELYLLLAAADPNNPEQAFEVDRVWMEGRVEPTASTYRVQNEDYLADADGDGVGDLNERLAATDPNDPTSVPGDVTVDILALYTPGFSGLYGGDPYGRILHSTTLANQIFRTSETGVRFRIVGFVETEIRNDWNPFSEPARAFLKPLEEKYGADLALVYRPFVAGSGICGWATVPAPWRGRIRFAERGGTHRNLATVFGNCDATTLAHELGHLLGLGHSLRQEEVGTFRWSRGHYILEDDGRGINAEGTIMTYGHTYLDRFSSPDTTCGEDPCGVAIDSLEGAHAVKSLNVTRFQVAALRPPQPDADGDGFVVHLDDDDANPDIWRDHDGDGINDDADTDDDGDGVADEDDAFPLDARDWQDSDGDGVGDNTDAFPEDRNETSDADGDGIGDNGSHEVPLFLAAGGAGRQSFVRVINRSNEAGEVRIAAFDDAGEAAEPVTMAIAAKRTVHFNSEHLERGDDGRGLAAIGAGSGDWRLVLSSALPLEVLAYVRTGDGFLTSMHETAPRRDGVYRVWFFNPASNDRQRSLLRLVNRSPAPVDVTITGMDDQGRSPGTEVRLTVPAGASRTLGSPQLETGDGVAGALGDGAGKWRLAVAASGDLAVMSLLESPSGHLSNLSSAPDLGLPFVDFGDGEHLFMFPAAGDERRHGFARLMNLDIFPNLVGISGYGSQRPATGDGETPAAEARQTYLRLPVNGVAHFNSKDLLEGKPSLNMPPIGASETPWWLQILGSEAIHALAYIRTSDGFVTSLHDAAPGSYEFTVDTGRGRHDVVTFNPASNRQSRSLLRLVNPAQNRDAVVTVTGIDDAGEAPGDPVKLTIPGWSARLLSAEELETGAADGLEGALGDGEGKWRLIVEADALVGVMSLLESAQTGHLTNLSTATLPRPVTEPLLEEREPGAAR